MLADPPRFSPIHRRPSRLSGAVLRWVIAGLVALVLAKVTGLAAEPGVLPAYSESQLLDEVQHRAFLFFQEKSDAKTGLAQDRARNDGSGTSHLASIASTGFALAALPIGVEHGWMTREEAQAQALKTLRFAMETLPQEHGFFHHFVDKSTGLAAPRSEVSSIDTGIFACGAMVAGQYFSGEVRADADAILERMDWNWMLTNGAEKPAKLVLSQGWNSEGRFLPWDYGAYSEALLIYLLGMGSQTHALPMEAWAALKRDTVTYGGMTALKGGPIFTHQMPEMFFPLKDRRDRLGYDYWVSSTNACLMDRQFCIDHRAERHGYGETFWGLNACDSPDGYAAFSALRGRENGTLSPTGALSSIMFIPEQARAAALAMYQINAPGMWGRYGFANAYNADRQWFDRDVIGIDLGMALLSVENARTGLIWRLMESHPVTMRAFQNAGLERTTETGPRVLRITAMP